MILDKSNVTIVTLSNKSNLRFYVRILTKLRYDTNVPKIYYWVGIGIGIQNESRE